jgi:hypothetical protein
MSFSFSQFLRILQKDFQFVKFTKIYDAAVNGTLDATDFHAGCDGKGPTLCIFRTGNGFVFGIKVVVRQTKEWQTREDREWLYDAVLKNLSCDLQRVIQKRR